MIRSEAYPVALITLLISSPVLAQSATAAFTDALDALNPEDTAAAVRIMQPLADSGNARAQHILGNAYFQRHDYSEAVKWYRLAAEQGDGPTQWNLGEMYQFGHGVAQDYVEAYKWFNLAAANDVAVRDFAEQAREKIATMMTPEQIAAAQELSKNWRPKQ